MLPLSQISLEVIAWTIGGFAAMSIGLRSWLSYRRNHNEITKYFGWFGFLVGTGEFVYQLPAWFTQDTAALRLWALTGDVFIYASMVMLARIVWSYSLKRYLRFGQLAAIIIAWEAITWITDIFTSSVTITNGTVNWIDITVAADMRAILYAFVLLPTGWYLLRQAFAEQGARGRLRAYVLGIAVFGAGLSLILDYLTRHGQEGDLTSQILLSLFVGLLFAIWAPVILHTWRPRSGAGNKMRRS